MQILEAEGKVITQKDMTKNECVWNGKAKRVEILSHISKSQEELSENLSP